MLSLQSAHLLYIPKVAIGNFIDYFHLNPKYMLLSHHQLNRCDKQIEEPMQLHLHIIYDFSTCKMELKVF